ncbi:hypothetical protein PVAND_002027 [Polypedilum vanderplanki]|uniref:Uncharacterized protein n=1 Tax=Polypedilum vanderplanki TaxID=319348 RepID=A0A9J6BR50_POLVA|nr:hypothetical protein PVAND_002027 [Polypedilum vanderplanki]
MSQNSDKNKKDDKTDRRNASNSTKTNLRDLQMSVVEKRKQVPKKIEELYKSHQKAIIEQLKSIEKFGVLDEDENKNEFKRTSSIYNFEKPPDTSQRLIELNKRLDVLHKVKKTFDN